MLTILSTLVVILIGYTAYKAYECIQYLSIYTNLVALLGITTILILEIFFLMVVLLSW